jgi:hypothetical protein
MPNWQYSMCGQLVKMRRMFTLKVGSGPVGCALLMERVVVIRITCGYIRKHKGTFNCTQMRTHTQGNCVAAKLQRKCVTVKMRVVPKTG